MTVRQDIDLLQRPPIRLEDQILRVPVVLSLMFLLITVFSLMNGYALWQTQHLQRQIQSAQLLENNSSQSLSQLQDLLDPEKRRQQHQMTLSILQQNLNILSAQDPYLSGFSQSLQTLASLHYPHLWLSEIRFDNTTPQALYLKGHALSPEDVSTYLQALQQCPALSHVAFRQLILEEAADHSETFVLDSQNSNNTADIP